MGGITVSICISEEGLFWQREHLIGKCKGNKIQDILIDRYAFSILCGLFGEYDCSDPCPHPYPIAMYWAAEMDGFPGDRESEMGRRRGES